MKTTKDENEAFLSKNETAIERLQTAIEGLRTDMEKNANSIIMKIMFGLGIATAFLVGVIAYVGLFASGA